MVRARLSQLQSQRLEHIRCYCGCWSFDHYDHHSGWLTELRDSSTTETVPGQHRFQTSTTNEQSQPTVQNCYVLRISLFTRLLLTLCCRASLPVILSLLALWFILFLFFAILYLEVFSLTKWGSAETRTQNYSSLGSALVMLAFMSTGYVLLICAHLRPGE